MNKYKDSINGHYEKLMSMFKDNSFRLSIEQQKQYIQMYCSEKLKDIIKNYI